MRLRSALLIALCTSGCTATSARISRVTCYSGTHVIVDEIAKGKVTRKRGHGLEFKSSDTGHHIEVAADCVVRS